MECFILINSDKAALRKPRRRRRNGWPQGAGSGGEGCPVEEGDQFVPVGVEVEGRVQG